MDRPRRRPLTSGAARLMKVRRDPTGSIRRAISLLLVFFVTALTFETFGAPRVRVVATTKLEVRGTQTDTGIKVFGKLVDDAGVGLGGVQVFVSVADASTPTVLLALPTPTPPAKLAGSEDQIVTNV